MYGAFTLFGRSFQDRSITLVRSRLQSEPQHARTLVWALTISLAATLVIDVSFSSSGYLDVSVHRVPCLNLCIQLRSTGVFPARFPHSDICGSMCICHSPQLFAAYHVFHRLLVPRHPPCALIASTFVRRGDPFTGRFLVAERAPSRSDSYVRASRFPSLSLLYFIKLIAIFYLRFRLTFVNPGSLSF